MACTVNPAVFSRGFARWSWIRSYSSSEDTSFTPQRSRGSRNLFFTYRFSPGKFSRSSTDASLHAEECRNFVTSENFEPARYFRSNRLQEDIELERLMTLRFCSLYSWELIKHIYIYDTWEEHYRSHDALNKPGCRGGDLFLLLRGPLGGGNPDGLPAEATILSADWKTYFGTRSIFTRRCAHLCARESAERFTRLRLPRHSTRLLFRPGELLLERTCARRSGIPLTVCAQLRRATSSSLTTDRQRPGIYEAPKLHRMNYRRR